MSQTHTVNIGIVNSTHKCRWDSLKSICTRILVGPDPATDSVVVTSDREGY